jgi:type II secretion system protein G
MNRKGFTLIELLIVVAIIGIVAAIAIPNLLTALQKGKQKATMGDMKSIGTAIESYITDLARAPEATTITELNDTFFVPFYIKKLPLNDGWGTAFQYARDDGNPDIYSVGSAARGGSFGGWTSDGDYLCTSLADFTNDIIFSNGQFTYGPRVKN